MPDAKRKSRAGRKPMDTVLMFKALVLSALYNLSDDQIEYQLHDRLSARTVPRPRPRGPGAGREDRLALSLGLAQAGLVEALFQRPDGHLARQVHIARGGQILDDEPLERPWSERQWRTIVAAPRNHTTREENKTIESGEVPEGWADK